MSGTGTGKYLGGLDRVAPLPPTARASHRASVIFIFPILIGLRPRHAKACPPSNCCIAPLPPAFDRKASGIDRRCLLPPALASIASLRRSSAVSVMRLVCFPPTATYQDCRSFVDARPLGHPLAGARHSCHRPISNEFCCNLDATQANVYQMCR
jgi:hypothetical protein